MKKIFYLLFAGLFWISSVSSAQFTGNWELVNGDNTSTVSSYALRGSKLFVSTYNGIFLSTNNGSDWISIKNNLAANFVNTIVVNGDYVFVGTEGLGIFVSTNDGNDWQEVNNGLSNLEVKSIAIKGDYIFAGTYIGIFLSTDNGNNWSLLDNVFSENFYVYSIAIDGENIFAGTIRGIFLSTDNGNSWKQINEGLINNHVMSFAFNDNNIFIGTEGGIFLSTDYGENWTECSTELNNKIINSILIKENIIFAGSSYNGFYYSTDMGVNWITANEGLENIFIQALAFNENYIFAGTALGTYRREHNITSVLSDGTNDINSISVYPNPSNDFIKIRHNLQNSSNVIISISNSLGQKVKEFVFEDMNKELYVDIMNLPTGVYFLNIKVKEFSKCQIFQIIR